MRQHGENIGHGHVWTRADGMKARCGGVSMCAECSSDDLEQLNQEGPRNPSSLWSMQNPVGTTGTIRKDNGDMVNTEVTSEAWVLGGRVVARFKDISGGYLTSRFSRDIVPLTPTSHSDPRILELLAANSAEVERRRRAESAASPLIINLINVVAEVMDDWDDRVNDEVLTQSMDRLRSSFSEHVLATRTAVIHAETQQPAGALKEAIEALTTAITCPACGLVQMTPCGNEQCPRGRR